MSWEDFGTLGALAVSGANQIPGCTATLSPTGLLTITLPSGDVPGMFTTYMNAALPAMDLSDEGVVYEVTAELVSKPAGLNLMVGQVTATPDTSVNTSIEAVAALNFQTYPAGVTATLAASNVRQRRSNDMAPGNNYERVLARVMAGPNPGIQVQLTSKNDIMVGGDVVIQLRVRRQVASAPAAGNVLHFRDPADGVFKPLTEVRVRGITDPPPPLDWEPRAFTMGPAVITANTGSESTVNTTGTRIAIHVPAQTVPAWGALTVAIPFDTNLRKDPVYIPRLRGVASGLPVNMTVPLNLQRTRTAYVTQDVLHTATFDSRPVGLTDLVIGIGSMTEGAGSAGQPASRFFDDWLDIATRGLTFTMMLGGMSGATFDTDLDITIDLTLEQLALVTP